MSSITKSRYLNIDALRGIAAFLVLLYHLFGAGSIFTEFLSPESFSGINIFYFIPAFGYVGVYLFFVISGFCIHLRWAKAYSKGIHSPEINFIAFWKRRWLRLYPAYLAAMVLFLFWQYWQGQLEINSLFVWDMISHLLMIHNLDARTVYSMNGVFWTLAIEEQLYLIYFLLLWMRKTWGWKVTLTICFITRFIWFGCVILLNRVSSIEVPIGEGALANWWIWALGAAAVENYLGITKFPRWCYSLILSFGFMSAGAYLHYIGIVAPNNFSVRTMWVCEPFCWGAGFFFFVNWIMQYENKLKSSFLTYTATIWATVGLFSYSLYLTHEVVLRVFSEFSPAIIIILSLALAYAFYLIFEKPFMLYLSRQKN